MRTSFGCGHRGKGKFCHRCSTADRLEAEAKRAETTDPETTRGWRDPVVLRAEVHRLRVVPAKEG